jgi:lipopolysaccharide biosynthesis glycosyltransferase
VLCFLLASKNKVNLAYMVDSKYLPYAMVSLDSAITNKKTSTQYNVYFIAKDFTKEDITKLKQMEKKDVKIIIYPTEEKNLDYPRLGRFSSFKISLQKIFLAEYLLEIKKVLYLDADTLVQKDLSELFATDISKEYVGAVKDGLMYQYPEHIEEIGLKDRDFYFNSGVMLLNLDKIRKENIIRKAIIYFNTHNEIFGDQDVLNVVFGQKIKPLSYRYNCNSTFFEEKDDKFLSNFWNETVPENDKDVYDGAAILHFAGHKPWSDWFNNQYLKTLWHKYATNTKIKYKITY